LRSFQIAEVAGFEDTVSEGELRKVGKDALRKFAVLEFFPAFIINRQINGAKKF